ncbi:MAG: hypothetical protein M3Q29_22860 [Chloroflexota bacterium]|nr:hypothetical protein [Chloroflexota bacterium]
MRRKVEQGYDRIAEKYLAARNPDDPRHLAELEEWGHTFPRGGTALDLGCGAGLPVARWLARRFAVTSLVGPSLPTGQPRSGRVGARRCGGATTAPRRTSGCCELLASR